MTSQLMSPRQHFEALVKPPVKAFLDDPGCEWKAICAAHALTDLIEWTCAYRQNDGNPCSSREVKGFRTEMMEKCKAIQPVRDVADAARHRFLTRDVSNRIMTTATGAFVEASASLGNVPRTGCVGIGVIASEESALRVNAPGTAYTNRKFNEIIGVTFEFWDKWITENYPENSLQEAVKSDYLFE